MFYDIFKQLCDQKGISCNKAALQIGLSNATPTKWKKTGATPVGETLDKIAVYFGVSTDYLLGKEDDSRAIENAREELSKSVSINPTMPSGKRLEMLFNVSGYDHMVVCYNLGIEQFYVDNWIESNDLPPKPIIDKILGVFCIKPEWLFPSSELKYYKQQSSEWESDKEKAPTDSGERKDVLDEVDIAFYGEYKELTEEDRATIRDMVSVMRKRRASEK